MHRFKSRFPRIVAAIALFAFFVCAYSNAADIDMSGTWKGTYAVDDPNVEPKVIITIRQSGGKYSGSISMPDENLNMGIRSGGMDDGYFSVSGVLPSKDAEGKPVQAHVTFGGFVEDDGLTWDGTWSLGGKDGSIVLSNLFTVTREKRGAIPTKPTTGGIGGPIATPNKPSTGTVTPKPDTSKPVSGGPVAKPASGNAGVAAGTWSGTYKASNNTTGTMTIEVAAAGDSGTGTVVDDDGTEMPPISFTSGTLAGKKFTLSGNMIALTEDGEEVPATVAMSGDLSGDSWRGTLSVTPEADDTAGLTATFRLTRSAEAKPSPAPTVKSSGGIGGKGKVGAPIR